MCEHVSERRQGGGLVEEQTSTSSYERVYIILQCRQGGDLS